MKYKVKKSVLDCKTIDTSIRRAKEEIKKQEIHENQGQEYVRAIDEKFCSYSLLQTINHSEWTMNISKLKSFEEWCMTYTGKEY